ncbi:unnamed protein product, partial [Brenthis ino]
MHFIYGKCRGNAITAATLYREKYPNARHPECRVFIRVHSEGRIPGSGVRGSGSGRIVYPDFEDMVLEKVEQDPLTDLCEQ